MEKVTFFMSSGTESDMTALSNSSRTGQSGSNYTGCLVVTFDSLRFCDDAGDLVTQETRLLIEDVVYIGLVPLLTVLGVVLNAMNMAVFVKQGLGDRVRLSMFSLSLADLLVLTSMCLQYISKLLAHIFGRDWERKEWLMPLVRYHLLNIPIGFQMVSIFISTMIAVDRCVCVTWPLKAARVLSTRVTGLIILVCSVLAFAGKQFEAFKFDVRCAVLAGKRMPPIFIVIPSDLYRSIPHIVDILDSFVLSTLVPNLSLLLTAAATAITAIKLKRATQWRDSTTGSKGADAINQKEKALTTMLIAISCIFMVGITPLVIVSLCQYFIPEYKPWGKFCNLLTVVYSFKNVLLAVNCSINFFVYYKMGSRFRQTLHQLLTCVKRWP